VFEECAGAAGPGTDMEELKDFVMAEMLWDPSLEPHVLIADFLTGYYGKAAPHIHAYMHIMHNSVQAKKYVLKACCIQPPVGTHKAFLTPTALLQSATAFKEALGALNRTTEAAIVRRVERASMAISYVFLWRWAELKTFASTNASYIWPLAGTKQGAFDNFARIYNATGTQALTSGTCHNPAYKGPGALTWLHMCIFDKCPS
jgi:hypothetical protein